MLSEPTSDRNLLLRRALRIADLSEPPDRTELRAAVRGYLAKTAGEDEVRGRFDTPDGLDRHAWRRLAADQGLVGIALPERYGGSGYGVAELAVVAEELGACLAFPSHLSTAVIGAHLLLRAGHEGSRSQYLPAIAAGDLLVGVRADPGARPADVAAEPDGTRWRLSGRTDFVLDAEAADVILVVATTADGPGLFACARSAVTTTPMATLDLTRRQSVVVFAATAADLVGPITELADALDRVGDLVRVALAAEQVGGAGRVLDLAVQYAQERHQFGRPIGSFQAVKHALADMLVDLEAARSACGFAIWAADTGDESLPFAAAMAQASCSATYFRLASQAVQIHGGMGFTWEHPAHLYFRRAKADEHLLGDATHHRARVAHLVGLR